MHHHIFCGDCSADAARPHLVGEVHVWKDSSAVGPCSADPDEHRELRASWWHIDPAQLQNPDDLPHDGELILWFGPDPWEQISQLELLAKLRRTASLIPLSRSATELAAHDFTTLLTTRHKAPDLAPIIKVWRDFCADDSDALDDAVRAYTDSPDLPHLAPALARVLADRRDRLTERRIGELVAAGTTDIPTLMRALASQESPHHGAWYGDKVVTRLRDAALAAPQ